MRDRGQEDQGARSRGVVQIRPGQLDLLQLAQNLPAEVLDGYVIASFRRVATRTDGIAEAMKGAVGPSKQRFEVSHR